MHPENPPITDNNNNLQPTINNTTSEQSQSQDNKKNQSSKPFWHKVFSIILLIAILADLYVLYLIASEILYGTSGNDPGGFSWIALIVTAAIFGFPAALITCVIIFGFFKTKPSNKV